MTSAISTVARNGSKVYFGDGELATKAGLVEPNGVALSRDGKTLLIADVAGHRIPSRGPHQRTDHNLCRNGPPESRRRWRSRGSRHPSGVRVPWTWDPTARSISSNARETGFGSSTQRQVSSQPLQARGQRVTPGMGGTGSDYYFQRTQRARRRSKGNVWIVDTENHVIRRIDAATRTIQTVAGNGQPGGDGDGGPATRARLNRPHGVAVGPDGSCWIADTNNHRVRLVEPSQ